jgi:hypothetical protein
MPGTRHPWRVGLDERLHGAQIQCPPPAPSGALVITWGPRATVPAPVPGLCYWPCMGHDHHSCRIELDILDYGPFQPEQLLP